MQSMSVTFWLPQLEKHPIGAERADRGRLRPPHEVPVERRTQWVLVSASFKFGSPPTTRTRTVDPFTIAASSTACVCAERVDVCCGQAGRECRSIVGRICLYVMCICCMDTAGCRLGREEAPRGARTRLLCFLNIPVHVRSGLQLASPASPCARCAARASIQ